MKERKNKLDAFAERIEQWFGVDKLTLAQAAAQLKLDGCSVSTGSLSVWWERRQKQNLQDRLLSDIAAGSRQCQEVEKKFSKNAAPELETLIKLHRVLILNLTTQGNADPEMIKLASQTMYPVLQFVSGQTKARLEEKKLALAQRRVELLEKKAAQADAAKSVATGKLTPEEKEKRYKQIFGLA